MSQDSMRQLEIQKTLIKPLKSYIYIYIYIYIRGQTGKQGEIVKRLQNFLVKVGLRRSEIHFKFLTTLPLFKKSALACSYFKINFKVVKNVYCKNVSIFAQKE